MAFRPYSQIDIAFSSVPWDRSYSDVPDFSDDSELLKYLESAIVYTFSFITADNARAKFNLEKDGITQPRDVIVPLSSIAGANISEPLEFIRNVNYMVARYTNQSGGYSYEYYFITDIIMVRPDVVKCSLEMDVFQTYRLNYHYGIKGGVVERKHCNRFEYGQDKATFTLDFSLDSAARVSDEIERQEWALKPIKKVIPQCIKDCYDVSDENLIPLGWLCAFYDAKGIWDEYAIRSNYENAICSNPYMMVAFPIFDSKFNSYTVRFYDDKYEKEISIGQAKGDGEYEILNYSALRGFPAVSESWAYGVNKKKTAKALGTCFSKACPFYNGTKIKITSSGLYIYIHISNRIFSKNPRFLSIDGDISGNYELPWIPNIGTTLYKERMEAPFDSYFFSEEQAKLQNADSKLEPKIYSPSFYKIGVNNPQGGEYSYNVFDAFYTNEAERAAETVFLMIDIPDIAAPYQYIGLSQYVGLSDLNAAPVMLAGSNAGLIYSATASIPIYEDQLAEYLRNNKNAYLTSVLSAGSNLARGAVGSALSGNIKSAVSGAFSAVSDLVSYQLKTDSLANAPINITFSKVSPSFIYLPSDSKFSDYIIYYSVSDADKAVIFDYFHRFGYPYNKTLDSENWFNRHYYDYIKLATPSIQMVGTDKGMVAIPTPAREKIAQALNRGVTFWHDMDYWQRYDIENWEKDIYEVLTK